MKLHLVDGTYELFRAHYGGGPPASAPDGRPVKAVRGLIQTLLLLLRGDDVTHVACVFDHVVESFRNDLFDGYKTGEGVSEDLMSQFGLAERAASALGLVVWPMVEFEADDAIATAASRWSTDVEQVVVCSPDKDLAQLVRDGEIVTWDRRRDVVLDEAGVVGKFGVPPKSVPRLPGSRGRLGRWYSRSPEVGRQVRCRRPGRIRLHRGDSIRPLGVGGGPARRTRHVGVPGG